MITATVFWYNAGTVPTKNTAKRLNLNNVWKKTKWTEFLLKTFSLQQLKRKKKKTAKMSQF